MQFLNKVQRRHAVSAVIVLSIFYASVAVLMHLLPPSKVKYDYAAKNEGEGN